jgi:hypothetical protein
MDILNTTNIYVMFIHQNIKDKLDIYHFALVPEEPMLWDCVQRVDYFEMQQVHSHLDFDDVERCAYHYLGNLDATS